MTNSTSDNRSGWAIGWTAFAGFMMIMMGSFHAVAGLVGIIKDEFYVAGAGPNAKWVFEFDATTWGWIHLLMGVVVVLAGIGLFSGNVAARTLAVILAVISAIANFMWLPYYPVWSVTIIAIDVAIIWALTAHGRDIAAE
jgi:hypothetical protein